MAVNDGDDDVMVKLDNPIMQNKGVVATRSPQARGDRELPAGIRIISADSHFEVAKDIFVERFPEELKHKAPRVWLDGIPRYGDHQLKLTDPGDIQLAERVRDILVSAIGKGAWDLDIRKHDIDAEGVEKEILFPQSLLSFIRSPDLELQEHVYRAYNEYIAEVGSNSNGRFYGVGVCSNWWDPAKAHSAIRQIIDLGLRAFMLPTQNVGKAGDGRPMSYGGEEMDPFWNEAAEAGLPICFHVGENVSIGTRGAAGASTLVSNSPFRKPFGEILFGGVFDRHPDLQFVFAEGGLSWIAPAIQDAEAIIDAHRASLDYIPQRRALEYWRSQCFATFQNDQLGLGQLDYIGVENAMWASDYPHNESTLGYGWDSVMAVIDTVGEEAAKLILGGNAIRLFRLDDPL
jgi:predicted TIM-barrel fold metal-dependent hydrolase